MGFYNKTTSETVPWASNYLITIAIVNVFGGFYAAHCFPLLNRRNVSCLLN